MKKILLIFLTLTFTISGQQKPVYKIIARQKAAQTIQLINNITSLKTFSVCMLASGTLGFILWKYAKNKQQQALHAYHDAQKNSSVQFLQRYFRIRGSKEKPRAIEILDKTLQLITEHTKSNLKQDQISEHDTGHCTISPPIQNLIQEYLGSRQTTCLQYKEDRRYAQKLLNKRSNYLNKIRIAGIAIPTSMLVVWLTIFIAKFEIKLFVNWIIIPIIHIPDNIAAIGQRRI